MKALTVKQPWASLIVEGLKDIENRTWRTNFRGRVLIHAGFSQVKLNDLFTFEQNEQIHKKLHDDILDLMFDYDLPLGVIIGSVEIVDCVINHKSIWAEETELGKQLSNKCIYNWVLANPIKFPEPIPAKGKLSFWEHNMQCPEFAHFGATYPDARCIDGYLWDLDSADGEYLTSGGDDPCPYCNPDEYLGQ